METWRLLPLQTYSGAMNMAIDEAIYTQRIADKVPNTLRFYRWNPSTITIGRNQSPENEIYLENAKKYTVDIVRRISGGGTVYHDSEGEVTYGLIAKTESLGSADVASVYFKIYEAISESLRLLGIPADFNKGDAKNCPNLTVGGKKLSGSAQAISRGVVVQHGTLLVSVDLPKMFELLKLKSKTCAQAADIASHKLTSIQDELKHKINHETVANALAKGFEATVKIKLEEGKLTSEEAELADKLYREKYSKESWNFKGAV